MLRHNFFVFATLVVTLSACPADDKLAGDTVDPNDTSAEVTDTAVPDSVVFDTGGDSVDTAAPDASDTSDAADGEVVTSCLTPGSFGCACSGNDQCVDEMCIEGADGAFCTKGCITECPAGFACLNTSLGGPDPVSICVPRHARLCRPCMAQSDCQSPLDPSPAACIATGDESAGSYCATSCALDPCPGGYACEDVAIGDTTQKLCVPESGECTCRPSWAGLGYTTACSEANETGMCRGSRTCGAAGLTACSAPTPSEEVCDKLDNDCDGGTDNVAEVACDISNEYGKCSGRSGCDENGQLICVGKTPALERCNGEDDDCNGSTDEADAGWPDCAPAGCRATGDVYIETGSPSCVSGHCVYSDPKPCGLYTCALGGDSGNTCASTCTDDTTCAAAAHCDETTGLCVPDLADGAACTDQSDCGGGHCQNGYCCATGDCCKQPDDCPAAYRSGAACEMASNCQGTRRDAKCVQSICSISEPLADDSGCSASVLAVDCTPYQPRYCTGALDQGAPSCPSSCTRDSDCVEGFHCDGTCVANVANGGACDEESDCASLHCQNGFCCGSGDCCSAPVDCPASYRRASACYDAAACQGDRVDALCVQNRCDSNTIQDDAGCDTNVEANGCGPSKSVFCSGAGVQSPPQCQFFCALDSDCDAGFHCDTVCVPNVPDGNFCDENSDCVSAHCQGGLCCLSGDCCNLARDCPASYTGPANCDFPTSCQGTRDAAQCNNHVCKTVSGSADDSACTNATVANNCGSYPSVSCNGQADQQSPSCATRCDSNGQCDANAYCDANACKSKKDDGVQCTGDAQCTSGHCQNGFCCASGDCCALAANCSAATYGTTSVCTDAATCQGERKDPVCQQSMCKLGTAAVADDSGCAGQLSDSCGYFTSVFCSAAANQNKPPCATSCSGNSACDDGAYCDNGTCKPNQGVGQPCTTSAQCGGLACVDNVCCASACGGTCKACNVTGNLGSCQNVPDNSDPDNECGAVSCTGYYWGFDAKTCYARANVAAAGASCNGAAACDGPGDVCPGAAKGAAGLVCHDVCQAPTAGSCQGTTPGSCTNISGGTQTCGVGQCARTVDKCSNGAPQACTPGQPSAEVCDGVDNDCDGLTDAADPDLVLVNCDNQKGVCAGAKKPASLCQAGTWKACTDANYSAYSANYQAGRETSCETSAVAGGLDNDCDGSVDEDFSYTGPDGTAVQGAGKACGVGVCAGGTTICGVGNTLICTGDVRIATETCDGSDNDCDGKSDSLDPSLQLIACDNQKGVCSGSTRPASLCAAGTGQNCTSAVYTAFSASYQASETLCDGKDNDCSGAVDNGLVAPNNSNQNGACAGTKKLCAGATGWVDNYGSVAGFGLAETPNGNFADENCDGIDGDVNLGLFVTTTGSATSACTQAEPCTIARALALVSAQKPQIYLRAGTYTGPFAIPRTIGIYGGYNTNNWSVRASRTTAGSVVYLDGGKVAAGSHTAVITASAIGSAGDPVVIADVNLRGASTADRLNGSGTSTYGVFSRNSHFRMERVDVIPATAASGGGGNSGASATQSAAVGGGGGETGEQSAQACGTYRPLGGAGVSQACPDSTSTSSGGGGTGGSKDTSCGWTGICSNCDATNGNAGNNASVTSGALGTGGGGGGTCTGSPPGTGNSGRVVDGSAGAGASGTFGYLDGSDYWFGFAGGGGSLGSNGGGGGGGGGAGGCDGGKDSRGGGGGGGGAGGCRATGFGTGGYSGGGSFGLFTYGGSYVVVGPSTLLLGSGGVGGTGGAGGLGQPGGAGGGGGAAAGGSVAGGAGGTGGRGGHAGAGGGGAGGASFAALIVGGTWSTQGVITYNPNIPGGATGGAGGTTGVSGGSGVAGPIGNVRQCTITNVGGVRTLSCP
ncbi:MAG: hypothetical protein JNJ59_05820 [Deltaproteobacteria bacterium]|nr:hypothetical protein [Deltaproteobacteria bacterium]